MRFIDNTFMNTNKECTLAIYTDGYLSRVHEDKDLLKGPRAGCHWGQKPSFVKTWERTSHCATQWHKHTVNRNRLGVGVSLRVRSLSSVKWGLAWHLLCPSANSTHRWAGDGGELLRWVYISKTRIPPLFIKMALSSLNPEISVSFLLQTNSGGSMGQDYV